MGGRTAGRCACVARAAPVKLVAHNDGVELRGNERQLLLIANGLKERGHDVVVSARARAPLEQALQAHSIPTTPIRPRGDLDFLAALAFRGWLREQKPDAVLLTSWKRVLTAGWSAHKAGVQRIVVRLGIVREAPHRGRAAWRLRTAFESFIDSLVVNSNDVAEAWLNSAPWFPRERLHVIHNAVQPVAGTRDTIRNDLGANAETKLVTYVGALEMRKGIDIILHALARLPAHVQFVAAGSGPEAETFKVMAKSLRVADRVHWLGPRKDVPDVLAASDAFVLASRQDSLANALLEAMSAGLPVITTQGTGVNEALDARAGRPRAGWVVEPENPDLLAAAISDALRDSASEREETRWRAQHWFAVEPMVTAYERVLFGP